MKISLISSGSIRDLELKNQKIELSSLRGILELILGSGETAYIIVNNSEEEKLSEGAHQIYSVFNNEKKCVVRIRAIYGGRTVSVQYTLHQPFGTEIEEHSIENLMHFTESVSSVIGESCSLEDVFFQALDNGRITLLSIVQPLTGYDNLNLIVDLQSALSQKVRAICSSPKQGTRVEELVQDVSLVKRINTNTLSHLSSHTEHWKARTLSGLIPKRLRADIIEDEINIYENLFFKMAIDDISDYVTAEILSLQKSMGKNSIAIDWERYGNAINDYRRGELIAKLTQGKDASSLNEENRLFAEILDEWMKISRILLTIKSSAFYRSIDRNKHISKSIHLTNILKNDQRYKALYDMWCLVQREKQHDKETKGITGDISQNPSVFYANYTCAALLYSMHLLGISFDRESVVSLKDGCIQVNACGIDNTCRYRIQSKWNAYKELELSIEVEERLEVAFELPNCSTADFSLENVAAFMEIDGNNAIFYRKPSPIEKNDIYTLCQKPQSVVRQMSVDGQTNYKNTLRIWREWVDSVLSSTRLRNPGQKRLAIKPHFIESEADKKRILELSDMLFNEATENDRTVFLLPTEWINYREIDDSRVLRRLLNFGESFSEIDEDRLKNYHLSVLPVTQTDVGSIQRLMKLISLQRSVLMMEWQSEQQTKCPICQGTNIHRTDLNSWKCDNPSCGVEWGKTKCTTKCKKWFHWIQPGSDMVKKLRFQDVQCDTPCEAIQLHESIFDRYVITDFEIETDVGTGNVKMYPICPICGGRRKNN